MRLEAKDVNISISGKPIVQHLSIEVPDRKFSALLGANGSGKTTLLRSIYIVTHQIMKVVGFVGLQSEPVRPTFTKFFL